MQNSVLCNLCQNDGDKLNPVDQDLVQRRTGEKDILCLCKVHYDKLIRYYSLNQKKCCDPLKTHRSPAKTNLQEIELDFAEQFADLNLIPGKKVCKKCRLNLIKLKQTTESSDSETICSQQSATSSQSLGLCHNI